MPDLGCLFPFRKRFQYMIPTWFLTELTISRHCQNNSMDLGKCSIPKSVFLEQQMKALDGTGGYPSKLDPQFHLTFTPIQRARPSVLGDST
jgi:hypothetical protein